MISAGEDETLSAERLRMRRVDMVNRAARHHSAVAVAIADWRDGRIDADALATALAQSDLASAQVRRLIGLWRVGAARRRLVEAMDDRLRRTQPPTIDAIPKPARSARPAATGADAALELDETDRAENRRKAS